MFDCVVTNSCSNVVAFTVENAHTEEGGGVLPHEQSNGQLHSEIVRQKLLVEEKTQDLEDRNLLLVKARNAINHLGEESGVMKKALATMQQKEASWQVRGT